VKSNFEPTAVNRPKKPVPENPFPLGDADLCVKCGLCLPHCPTYTLRGVEAESPRGRIALLQGLTTGLIPLTATAERHLDNCLHCRSCDTVCPAKVPYAHLIDAGRTWLLAEKPQRQRLNRWIAFVLADRWARKLAFAIIGLLQLLNVTRLLGRQRRGVPQALTRAASLIPTRTLRRTLGRASKPRTGARGPEANAPLVQIFQGCLGDPFEQPVLADLRRLLNAAGYVVEIPAAQQCCGALHLHSGQPKPAIALYETNARAFAGDAPVIALASGCAAGLRDAAQWRLDGQTNRPSGTSLHQRLSDFAAVLERGQPLHFQPLNEKVAVHLPCTQRNAAEGTEPMLRWLRKIPGIELIPLHSPYGCCGAAGTHFLTQGAAADELLAPLLADLKLSQARILVSANIGCRLHWEAGLRRAEYEVNVIHPATLLARQLQET